MKLQLTFEPTEQFFKTEEAILVRAWTGHTNRGTPVTAFIAALSAPESHGKELAEQFMEIPDPQVGQVKIKEEKPPEKSC
jgi:hypothetical protein